MLKKKPNKKTRTHLPSQPLKRSFLLLFSFHIEHCKNIRRVFLHMNTCRQGELTTLFQLPLGMLAVSISHMRDVKGIFRNAAETICLFQIDSSRYRTATHQLFIDLCQESHSPITTVLTKTFYLVFG